MAAQQQSGVVRDGHPSFSVEPAKATRIIYGHPYEVRLWSPEVWLDLPDHEKPPEAQPIGDVGFIDIQPLSDSRRSAL